jgi:hypothetical protein
MAPQRYLLAYRAREDLLGEVEKVYGLIMPPDESGADKHTLLYGRSLLVVSDRMNDLQEQINETKHNMAQALLSSSQNSNNDAAPSSEFDSINERLGDVESGLADAVAQMKSTAASRAASVSAEVLDVEIKLSAQINDVEKALRDMEHDLR